MVITNPNTDANTRHYNFPIIKSLLDLLPNLAPSRILNIIKNHMHLVVALPVASTLGRIPGTYLCHHPEGGTTTITLDASSTHPGENRYIAVSFGEVIPFFTVKKNIQLFIVVNLFK